ncbi:beta-ketoacyl reductase [Streptomyces sp. HPF1205]|uniref:beta-ketoacyl reductase n=1 Tax=Streptomyces sp. HPF1205 TaxID=2873262 RepID=UPI001CEDA077|nr:beta-ketoacyl reductase [Streptomyces sp. HPF1205]
MPTQKATQDPTRDSGPATAGGPVRDPAHARPDAGAAPDPRTERNVAGWRYRIVWKALQGDAGPAARPAGTWLLAVPPAVADDPLVEGCAQALTAAGAAVVRIAVDGTTAEAAPPSAALVDELAGLDFAGVLSFTGLDERRRADHPSVTAGLAATVALLQALGAAGRTAPLWCVTRGAVAPGADEPLLSPVQAQIWGVGRVAALEHPDLWGGLIDVTGEWDAATADRVLGVLAGRGEDQVAVRPSGVLARRLARALPVRHEDGRGWRPRGCVLVTGGTGGLGAEVARWAAAHGAEHLVLLSRRGADAPGVPELEAELAAAGAAVTVAACDVADREALSGVLAALPDKWPLTAVVHAAGVDFSAPLTGTGPAELARSLGAKTTGAALLDELLGDTPLDAFVVFSSIAGVWGGGGGLGAYGAANAFLDALTEQRRRRGRTSMAMAWGPWDEIGMAAHNTEHSAQLNRFGLASMPPASAMAAFALTLEGEDGVVAVADVEWERFALAFAYNRPSPLLADLPEAG